MVLFPRVLRPAATFAVALVLFAAGCGDDDVTDPAPPASAPAVFVVNTLGETLSRYLPETGQVAANALPIGAAPNDMAIAADGRTGYVVCSGANRIDVVDLDELVVVRSIDLGPGAGPYAIALAGAEHAYVSNWVTGDVAHVDLVGETVVGHIAVGAGPEGLLFLPAPGARGANPPAGDLVVAVTHYRPDWSEIGEVALVSVPADTVRAAIDVGTNPQSVALAPDGLLHVVCTGDYVTRGGKVYLLDLDLEAVVDSVAIDGTPVAALPIAGGKGWTVGYAGGLRSYDVGLGLSTRTAAIPGASSLNSLAYDAEHDLLYVSDFAADSVFVVALAPDTLATSFGCGDGPVDLAIRR